MLKAYEKNHYSSGTVALDNKASYTYAAEGEFDVVLVASSYSYSKDKYKESLTVKKSNSSCSKIK